MSDPSLVLQDAAVKRLKATASVTALVADRIYGEVPLAAQFPYIVVGAGQVAGDDIACAEVSEVYYQFHVWARPPGAGSTMKKIAGEVRAAMSAPLVLAGFENQVQEYQQTQWLDDPDGLTQHAMVEFRFIIVH